MSPTFRTRLLASALAVSVAVALPAFFPGVSLTAPAQAQQFSVSFSTFHDQLADYGVWVYSDRWGMVWQPDDVGPDFHPYYTDGRWVRTREYGTVWASDYEWGDIAFHYGRWVNDPYDGWLWIPGYTWSPGWVVWRSNDRYMGWMPLPPDDDFLRGAENTSFRFSFGGVAVNFNDTSGYYGYSRWYGRDYDEDRFARNWVFVGTDHFGDRDYRSNAVRQPAQVINVIRETRNVTNYTVVNNYIVNRSADAPAGRRAGPRQAEARPASEVLKKPAYIRNVESGRQAQRQGTQDAPRGRGIANSAPPPAAAVAQRLSERGAQRSGRNSGRLLTRETISNPPGANAPAAKAPAMPAAAPQPADQNRGNRERGSDERERQQQANQQREAQDRANQAKAKQEEAAKQEQASQQRAVQERAAQQRAGQDRANEDRGKREQADRQRETQQRETQQREAQQRETQQRESEAKQDAAKQEQAARQQQATQQRAAEERANAERGRQEQAERQRPNQERGNPRARTAGPEAPPPPPPEPRAAPDRPGADPAAAPDAKGDREDNRKGRRNDKKDPA